MNVQWNPFLNWLVRKYVCNHGDISDKELATLAKIDVYEDRNEGKREIILFVKIII